MYILTFFQTEFCSRQELFIGSTQETYEMAENTFSDNAAEQVVERLSDQLSCSVCQNEYRTPRVLPCLHVFCEACLKRLVETQTDKLSVPCPKCRKSTPLPRGGVSSLPAASYIQHLFEVRETLEKVCNSNKKRCDKCEEGDVTGFCRDCGQFICQLCWDMHQKWREMQSHEISSLYEVQQKPSKIVTRKKESMLCPRHPTNPIDIYCETCEELICRDCTVKTHCDHNYNQVPDVFPTHRSSILTRIVPVKAERASLVKNITELKERSSRLDGRGAEAMAKVDSEIDKLQAILETRRRDLHSEIHSKVCQGKKELEAQIDKHELRWAQLSGCVEFVEGSLQNDTQEEVLSMKRQVEQRTMQIADEFNPQRLQLGQEQVRRVVCACLTPAHQILREVSFEWVQFEGTHVKTIDGIKRPRHIAFAATGEMVLCELGGNCVTLFDCSNRRLRSFGSLVKPKGVAISSDNTIFVTSNHCVKKFTLEGRFIASVGSQGSGRLQFNIPCAIAYNRTNNRVYVCDTHNNRIAILNHDLTFHDSFGSKGMEITQLHRPEGIAVDNKGNVLVADYGNNRIQIFDENGHYLSSITHTVPGQQLRGPYSVSDGPGDCVYVAECDSNAVSVFDDNGKYIKSFGKRGNKDGEFNSPCGVAASDDGYVYVSDTDNRRVQMFK